MTTTKPSVEFKYTVCLVGVAVVLFSLLLFMYVGVGGGGAKPTAFLRVAAPGVPGDDSADGGRGATVPSSLPPPLDKG